MVLATLGWQYVRAGESLVSAVWSYVLAGVGISGLLIAARHPKIGWWFNISTQALWATYAIVTRQWGFLASTAGYTVAYARLLVVANKKRDRA